MNDLKARNSGGKYVCRPGMAGQVVPVRVERVGARGEEAVEGVRKGWGIRSSAGARGTEEGREGGGGWASEAGSGRRWNTNMRIKAVEGIKAYNRSADLSGLRLSVCAAIRLFRLYFGLFVRAFVNGSRPPCGHRVAVCGFIRPSAFATEKCS